MSSSHFKMSQKRDFFTVNKQSKLNKKIKKQKVRFLPEEFNKLEKCSSKKVFVSIMKEFPPKYKKIIQIYITDFLFADIYSRKLKHRTRLLCKKTFFHRSLDNPIIMEKNKWIQNSEIKQFCSVTVRFISKNYTHLKKIYEQKY
jgi:hypothetical protein